MGREGRVATILWTEQAVRQLSDIPARIVRKIIQRVDVLEQFPEIGSPVLFESYEDWRQLIVDPYRIAYRYDPGRRMVEVRLIQHVRRAWTPQTE